MAIQQEEQRQTLQTPTVDGAQPPVDSGEGQVKARGYWEQVWRRLKRDRVALLSLGFIILLPIIAFVGAPVAAHFLGHGPNDQNFNAIDPVLLKPVGPLSTVPDPLNPNETWFMILGADGTLGRDEFLRVLYGAQVSLEVAVGATILGMFIGVLLGSVAGYFRGWVDTIISRVTEITMAFPALLVVIALA